MFTNITITGFKGIQGSLELKNLEGINYFVGVNGSGKSSILEAILFFKCFHRGVNNSEAVLEELQNNFYLADIQKLYKDNFSITLKEQGKNKSLKVYINENTFLFHEENPMGNEFAIDNWPNGNYFTSYINPLIQISDELNEIYTVPNYGGQNHNGINKIQMVNPLFANTEIDEKLLEETLKHFEISLPKSYNFKTLPSGLKFLYLLQNCIDELNKASKVSGEKQKSALVLIEEPEICLHPKIQKKLPEILRNIVKNASENENDIQFFITTQSPFIINSASDYEHQVIYSINNGKCTNPEGSKKTDLRSISNNLGMIPSDLFFSNCLIWVEGPSDAIYINFWLQKYIENENKLSLKKGLHYEFALLGGASASNFYLLEDDYEFNPKEDEYKKIFNLLNVHPNSFVIVDNDGGNLLNDIEKKGTSKFEGFKIILIKEFKKDSFWYEENPEIHTVECYAKLSEEEKKKGNKKEKALKYIAKNEHKSFYETIIENKNIYPCEKMIQKIYKKIKEANNI